MTDVVTFWGGDGRLSTVDALSPPKGREAPSRAATARPAGRPSALESGKRSVGAGMTPAATPHLWSRWADTADSTRRDKLPPVPSKP